MVAMVILSKPLQFYAKGLFCRFVKPVFPTKNKIDKTKGIYRKGGV